MQIFNLRLRKIALFLYFIFVTIALFSDYDVNVERAKIKDIRDGKVSAMKDKPNTNSSSYKVLDNSIKDQARKLEADREAALKQVFDDAGVEWPPKYTGTSPREGGGILSDIDTRNMPKEDIEKLVNTMADKNKIAVSEGRKPPFTVSEKNGYIQIKEFDATIFKQTPDVGYGTRALDKETVIAYKTDANTGDIVIVDGQPVVQNKHIYNLDNIKKMGGEIGKPVGEANAYDIAKGTKRIIENTYGKTPPPEAQKLLEKCKTIMEYRSTESAGIITEEQKLNFKNEVETTLANALNKTGEVEDKLSTKVDQSRKEVQDIREQIKSSKEPSPDLEKKLKYAEQRASTWDKKLTDFQDAKFAAENGIVENGGQEILAKTKGENILKKNTPSGNIEFEDLATGKTMTQSQFKEKFTVESKAKVLNPPASETIPTKTAMGKIADLDPALSAIYNRKLPNFAESVNIVDNAIQVYDVYNQTGDILPSDMDPNTKAGIKVLVATTAIIIPGGPQSAIAGGQAGFDELVKWYKEHPGQEPTNLESLGIGMRGANNFVKDMAKNVAYGFTVKPFADIYDIGSSGYGYYQDRKNQQAAEQISKDMIDKVKTKFQESLDSMKKFCDDSEKRVEGILEYPEITKEEKRKSQGILDQIGFARTYIDLAEIESQGRLGTMDERLLSYRTALKYTNQVGAKLKELIDSVSKCTLSVKISDQISGKDITKCGWVKLVGQDYKNASRNIEKGYYVFRDIPSGSYKISVYASEHKPKEDREISINIAKKRNFTMAVTLEYQKEIPVDYTAKVSEETKKIDDDLKKEAKNVKDTDLEKAQGVINTINNLANDGIILSRKAALDNKLSTLAYEISKYSNIKQSEGAELFMASGSGIVQPFIRNGSVLCAADMLYSVAYDLKNGSMDLDEIAPIKKALAEPSEASGSKDAQYALGLVKFYIEYLENQAFNVSNIRWYKAYKEYQDSQKISVDSKQGADKKSDKRDSEYWLATISAGGYNAVASELDKVWNEDLKKTLSINDDKNFKTDNPFIIKDYRNKYITGTILPAIFAYTEANKLEKEKIFLLTLKDFANVLNSCTVTIKGSIKAGPEDIPFKTTITCGKKKDEKSGTGSFAVTYSLKDMEYSNIGISIDYKSSNDYLVSSGSRNSTSCSLDIDRAQNFYELRVLGSNIEITLDPYLYEVINVVKYESSKSRNTKADLPQLSSDKVTSALSAASQKALLFDSIGYDRAYYEFYFESQRVYNYLKNLETAYSNANNILSDNCSVDLKGVEDEHQRRMISKSYDDQKNKLQKEIDKIRKSTNDSLKDMREKIDNKRKDISQQETNLNKEASALWKSKEAEQKNYHEINNKFDKTLGDYISQMNSLHSNRDENQNFDFNNPEFIGTGWHEDRIKEYASSSSEIASLQNEMRNLASALGSSYDTTFKLATDLQKLKKKISGPNCFDIGGEAVFYNSGSFSLNYIMKQYLNASLVATLNLSKFIIENNQRVQWYLNKRGMGLKNIDAMLAEAEKLVNELPSESKISEANGEVERVADKVEGYSLAIVRAVMAEDTKDVSNIPSGILDSKGSDETFVKECAGIMAKLNSSCGGVVGDMFPPSMSFETPFTKLQDVIWKLPWSELTDDQRKKWDAIRDKMKPMWERYQKQGLLKVWALAIVASLEGLGNTPEERVIALVAKNQEVLAHMQSLKDDASSVNSIEAAQKFIKEALDWYDMMPDIPTVACITERCKLFELVVKTGVFENYRKSNNLPPAPETISVFGKNEPYNGGCIVFKFSQLPKISADLVKAYDNTEWKGKFTKSLFYRLPKNKDYKLEYSTWNGENQFYSYYDSGKDQEWPIGKEWLPFQINIYMRNVSEKDNKSSRVKYEPGITILVLP